MAALSFPAILSVMLRKFRYKYTILYISPIFLLNILQPLLFVEQLPKSVSDLLKSYIDTFKGSVTPFFLLNSLLGRGVQLSVLMLVFSHISSEVNNQTAVISSTVFGFSYLVSSLSSTLILLKLKLNCYVTQIFFNVASCNWVSLLFGCSFQHPGGVLCLFRRSWRHTWWDTGHQGSFHHSYLSTGCH